MTQPEENGPSDPVDRWIEPFFSEPTLWPVLAVLVLSLVTFGAAAILMAMTRSVFAWLALVVVAGASAEALYRSYRRGRLGRVGGLILALWLLSIGLASLVRWLGVF